MIDLHTFRLVTSQEVALDPVLGIERPMVFGRKELTLNADGDGWRVAVTARSVPYRDATPELMVAILREVITQIETPALAPSREQKETP